MEQTGKKKTFGIVIRERERLLCDMNWKQQQKYRLKNGTCLQGSEFFDLLYWKFNEMIEFAIVLITKKSVEKYVHYLHQALKLIVMKTFGTTNYHIA